MIFLLILNAITACEISFPSQARPLLKTAVIFEWASFHDEFFPTNVALLESIGVQNVHILKLKQGREFDIMDLMEKRKHNVSIYRANAITTPFVQLLNNISPSVVILNTVELNNNIIEFMHVINQLPSNPYVIAGCHNAQPCIRALQYFYVNHPSLRITALGYSPRMVKILTKTFPKVPPPIGSIPFYLGQNVSLSPGREFTILVPGTLDRSRKDYRLLEFINNMKFSIPIKVVLFGSGCISCVIRQKKQNLNPNVKYVFDSGNFSKLIKYASDATFIASLVTNKVGNYKAYASEGKLLSSIVSAVAFIRPLIIAEEIAREFGFEDQITHKADGQDFGQAVNKAINVHMEKEQYAYKQMQSTLCTFRKRMLDDAYSRLVTHGIQSPLAK